MNPACSSTLPSPEATMSYILDALKRAESERSRGSIPNIHASAATTTAPEAGRPAALRIGLGVIALSIVVVAGWVWWPRSESTADPMSASEPLAALPATVPAPAPVIVAPAPAAGVLASAPTTTAMPQPGPPGPARAGEAPPANAPPRKPSGDAVAPVVTGSVEPARSRKAEFAASASAAVAEAASQPATPVPATVAASTEERVYVLKDLPADVRSSLPVLAVGGATYSENPANRMLIVNGALFHEGDKLAPEVTLQQIKLRSAVLSYRGYRYVINY